MADSSNNSREGAVSPALGSLPVLRNAGFAAQLPTTPLNKGERGGLAMTKEEYLVQGQAAAVEGRSQTPSRPHSAAGGFSAVETSAEAYGKGMNPSPLPPSDGAIKNDGRRGTDTASYTRTASRKR